MKKFVDLLGAIWTGLSTHKLRSFLTILGVVIGVAAVIVLMSVGQGTTANILSSLQGLGSNLLFVSPGQTVGSGGVRTSSVPRPHSLWKMPMPWLKKSRTFLPWHHRTCRFCNSCIKARIRGHK